MPSSLNPKDMELLSNAIFDGDMQFEKLPEGAKLALGDYWASAGIDFSNPEQSERQLDELITQRQEQVEGGFFDSPIFKPIEWIGSKLYWLYSETVSPILSSGLMAAHSVIYGRPEWVGQDGGGYWEREWDGLGDYWDAAHAVSPGQAIWMLGLNDKELEERGIRPDQMAMDKKLALEGKLAPTKDEKGLLTVQTKGEKYFGEGASKYVTGTADLAVSWYADPLVLVGKGAGAARQATYVQPVSKELQAAQKAAVRQGLPPQRAFDLFAQTPKFQAIVDDIMKIKVDHPDNAALIMRRDFTPLSKSANGDALASLFTQAKDADEVAEILRVSMGDRGGKLALDAKNTLLSSQITVAEAKKVTLGQYFDSLDDASKQGPVGQMIKQALGSETAIISKMNADRRIIDDKLDAFMSIENMNYNKITTPIGMKIRGSKVWQDPVKRKDPTAGKISAAGRLVYNSTIGYPIKVIRSYNDIKPSMYIDVHGENSYKEVDAALRETKWIPREAREKYVSDYVAANPAQRQDVLLRMEQDVVRNMVARVNRGKAPGDQITEELARDLYQDFARRRRNGQVAAGSSRSYGTATMPDPADPTRTIRVAEVEADGGRMVSTPIFDTQLANSHIVMDFGHFEKALKAHGSAWQKRKNAFGAGWEKAVDVADTLSSVWKFAQLFRLGYAPRALADDFLGQLARFGGMAMIGRASQGGKVMMEDFLRGKWATNSVEAARQRAGILDQELDELAGQQFAAQRALEDAAQTGASPADIVRLQDDLRDITAQIDQVRVEHADLSELTAAGAQMRDIKVGRQVFAAPFAGKQGELYRDLASGNRNFQNLMGSQSDWYFKRLRSINWENITSASPGHMNAWLHNVNNQIAQSSIGRQALAGKTEGEIVAWMRNTPEGQKYRSDIGLKNIPDNELAQRVIAQVDYVLDPAIPGMAEARAAALRGDLKKDMLEVVPAANRPMINAEQFKYATGESPVAALLDRSIQGWYNIANQIPAQRLLRNPLFGQQYKANLVQQMKVLEAQGVKGIDEAMRKTMEEAARKAALRDVKRYTFTMDHETKMAYMMRNFGAFFGAQQESWNRWARIIAEKPQALAHVAQTYGAPARAGIVVDQDGNPVDATGHVTDPVTGERRLTEYTDRKMLIQIPEYLGGKGLNKALGLDEEASFVVPMSSVELILNNGDGALPVGAGPYVQIGANHFAQDDPKFADWAKKLGVLPFGPQDSWTDFINPNTGKRLGDATDDMSETKQRALFYMMQVENYKYETGLRETEPTWDELMDRADRWTIFRTAVAWALPFSVNGQDPYQFFRDEYSRMQKLDPKSSDEKFYEKYGESFYLFSQSMSKNNTGLRPTAEAVQMSQYYKDMIDKFGPEYAGLIVGHEGDGVYSEGAYFYQKTHSASAASNVTQRGNMSASEAWKSAQVSLGWQQYHSMMEDANSQLFDRGLKTFEDPGAEDLQAYRRGVQKMLTQRIMPDGTENPFYNEEWEKEFSSLDKGKYDRTAANLLEIVRDPELWSKAVNPDGTVGIRSDIYTLRTYLEERKNMLVTLYRRDASGGSSDITAQSNWDLKSSWDDFVMRLLEADTKFAWVHSRWFATDMGFNLDVQAAQSKQEEIEFGGASLTGADRPELGQPLTMFDSMEGVVNG